MPSTVEARSPIEWIEAGRPKGCPPVQGRHPSQYAWRPRRPPDTVPDLGRFPGVRAPGVMPAGAGGEPGALTAHARFWEGPGVNWTWIKYCDTTRGNGWTTGKTNRILNPKDPGLLTRSGGSDVL